MNISHLYGCFPGHALDGPFTLQNPFTTTDVGTSIWAMQAERQMLQTTQGGTSTFQHSSRLVRWPGTCSKIHPQIQAWVHLKEVIRFPGAPSKEPAIALCCVCVRICLGSLTKKHLQLIPKKKNTTVAGSALRVAFPRSSCLASDACGCQFGKDTGRKV